MKNIFVDTETYWRKANRKLGLSAYSITQHEPTANYVRHPDFECFGWAVCTDTSEPVWMDEPKFKAFIRKLSRTGKPFRLVAHNTRFDGFIVTERYGVVAPAYGDTLSMARVVLGCKLRDFSLGTVSKYYGKTPKGDVAKRAEGLRWADMTPEFQQEMIEYALDDVSICRDIFNEMRPHIPDKEMDMIDWVLKMQCDPQFDLDCDVLRQVIDDEEDRMALAWGEYTSTFSEYYDPDPDFPIRKRKDVRGRKAVPEALWMLTGDKPPMKISPSTGKPTWAMAKTDMAFVGLKNHENPVVGALVNARLEVFSTGNIRRAERLLKMGEYQLENDLRFPIPLNASGALNTHRLSGGDYLNMQNLKRGNLIRASIIAPKGMKVWAVDSSGIELRVAAWLIGDADMTSAIAEGRDLYCEFASELYGETVERLPEEHELHKFMEDRRTVGKIGILSLQYQVGFYTYWLQVWVRTGMVIDQDVAKRAVGTYRSLYKMKAFWDKCEGEIIQGIVRKQRNQDETETPLTFAPFCSVSMYGLRLPSGLRLHYPHMKKRKKKDKRTGKERLSWSYLHQGYPKWVYGGLVFENLCICGEAEVLTRDGWIKLKTLGTQDVWDGEGFVAHDGLAYKGVRYTIEFNNVYMTPDHEVWDGQWTKACYASEEAAVAAYVEMRGLQPSSTEQRVQATYDLMNAFRPVWDIMNCGPLNRFVVRAGVGRPEFIVHNCQALAREIVMYQALEIDKHYPVRHFVHDEAVGVVDEDEAADAVAYAIDVMSTSPDWWPEIVLDAAGTFGDNYLECK